MRRSLHNVYTILVTLSITLPLVYGNPDEWLVRLFSDLNLLLAYVLFILLINASTTIPDIDVRGPNGIFEKLTYLTIYLPFRMLNKIRRKDAPHRGFTHTFTGILIISIFWSIIGFFIGGLITKINLNFIVEDTLLKLLLRFRIPIKNLSIPVVTALFFFISVSIGLLLHILEDSYTIAGIRILGRKIRGRLKTGSTDIISLLAYGIGLIFVYGYSINAKIPGEMIGVYMLGVLLLTSLIFWKLK